MPSIERAPRTAILVAASAVVAAGCWASSSTPPTDAGDVAAADAGNDAGAAPTMDAGSDAGVTCAWGMSDAGTCDDAVQLSAGGSHTCALRASGRVVCWGANSTRQLGDGTIADRFTPVAVAGLYDAVEISAGGGHTCARRTSGAVSCWGGNTYGQLGDGTLSHSTCSGSADCSLTPVSVSGLTDTVEISAGAAHTCARRASGAVVCWGNNHEGELGDGTTTHSTCLGFDCALTPVTVPGLSDAVEISAGMFHSCARRASGAVVCWGLNSHGQLGDGTLSHSTCAGPADCSLTPVAVSGLTDAVELAAGAEHTCARRASGAIACWGWNAFGQLGDGTTSHSACVVGDCSFTPVTVSGLTDAVGIGGGGQFVCARLATGAVVCWGGNSSGELGNGTTSHSTCTLPGPSASLDCSLTPVAVSGLGDATEVSVGDGHTCARRVAGEVVCWGRDSQGALGDGAASHTACPSGDCAFTPVTVATPPT